VSRRNLQACGSPSLPPEQGGLEEAHDSLKVMFLASVFAPLLLVLPVALVCQTDSSDLPSARMWRLFVVTLDVASCRFSSCGAASLVYVKVASLWFRVTVLLFHFSFFVFSSCLS
jgi:hypothetical protein